MYALLKTSIDDEQHRAELAAQPLAEVYAAADAQFRKEMREQYNVTEIERCGAYPPPSPEPYSEVRLFLFRFVEQLSLF